MKTMIFYFTGTGNSLAVAKQLCSLLGDCEFVPITSIAGTTDKIAPAADRVGIVTPVYFLGLPSIVSVQSTRLDLSKVQYVFAVATMGGSGGSTTLRQLDTILREGPGNRGLDAGFSVKMPGNYILMYDSPSGKEQEEMLAAANRNIREIADKVQHGAGMKPSWSPIGSLVHVLMYPRFIAKVHENDRKFTVDDRCTSCNTCVEVCPVSNIRLEEGRPVWLHHCEQCLACIHLCPTNAIQAGAGTETRKRYRNPDVEIKTLKEQRRG